MGSLGFGLLQISEFLYYYCCGFPVICTFFLLNYLQLYAIAKFGFKGVGILIIAVLVVWPVNRA